MKQLLECFADCWRQSDTLSVAEMVRGVDANGDCSASGVPSHLQADYNKAVAAISVFPIMRDEFRHIGDRLQWSYGDLDVPDEFKGRFAIVELVGPSGMIINSEISFGFVLQTPEMAYPSHKHAANEHFVILSGTADWQKDSGSFEPRPPGSVISHASFQSHAVTTHSDPMLAMWFWQGDIDKESYQFSS